MNAKFEVITLGEKNLGKNMKTSTMKVIVLILYIAMVTGQKPCDETACQLPDCRCYSNDAVPGGLELANTPQIVVMTMDYRINSDYKPLYDEIFIDEIKNPNGCPIRGTFFIQTDGSDQDIIGEYYSKGFEIGVNSIDGSIPSTDTEWVEMVEDVKKFIVEAGVDEKDILGLRSPQLAPGGNEMFDGLGNNGMLYAASCVSSKNSEPATLKWPFTLDYDFDQYSCNSGKAPDLEYPGKWQVLLSYFDWNGTICATPQSCPNVEDEKDAFDLLYNNFAKHFEGPKTPFIVAIDPEWMKVDYKKAGLIQFVDYLRAAFEDVWILSQLQALKWIQDPTPNANLTNFAPWSC